MGSPPTCTSKQFYNNPINLYSSDNVAEIAKMNKMGVSGFNAPPPVAHHTSKPPQPVILTPSKDYNPTDSATWHLLHESDPTIVDPETLKTQTNMEEHNPIFADVFTPSEHRKSVTPQPPGDSTHLNPEDNRGMRSPSPARTRARSPVADLLPPNFGGRRDEDSREVTPEPPKSAVTTAALAESKPFDPHSKLLQTDKVSVFELNSIGGGRKKIAQSATFNKVMMNVLGE